MTSDNPRTTRRRIAVVLAIACAIVITTAVIAAIRGAGTDTTTAAPTTAQTTAQTTSTPAPADTTPPDVLTCDAYYDATGYNSTEPEPDTPQQWGTTTRDTMTRLEARIAPGTAELVTTPLRTWIATQHERATIALSGGATTTLSDRAHAESLAVQSACRTAAPRSLR